jgi:5-(aminomethyl)-3-furanmethanol phosphate kinase
VRAVLTVVKVGGGLGRGAGDEALRTLCRTLGELGRRHALVVVPGGAGFADAVRDADRRFGLRAVTAHRMAILGMEQFGWLLSELIPHAVRCADLGQVREQAREHVAVVLPAGLPLDALPESWQVTSDSIAGWVARQVGADRLVLVKATDGLVTGGVDEYLPTVLQHARFETWVIGGRDPARVVELLERGTTVGTRIGPGRLVPWRHG